MVVEDDIDINNMLHIYFTGIGYEVIGVYRGEDALTEIKTRLPDLILLDIMLPGILGDEVCKRIRTKLRTRHIPIIFLTQRDQRSDRLEGLKLGADDYITKPFDIEELTLRVTNTISRQRRDIQLHPSTGLPGNKLIHEQLEMLLSQKGWTYLQIGIEHIDPFTRVYGDIVYDNVLWFTSSLLGELIDEFGSPNDFIGHARGNIFIVVTTTEDASALIAQLRQRFNEEIVTFYSSLDRQRGEIILSDDSTVPFMRLSIGVVSDQTKLFTDVQEIINYGTESQRIDQYLSLSTTTTIFGNVAEFKQWLKELVSWAILIVEIKDKPSFTKHYGGMLQRKIRELMVEVLLAGCETIGHNQARLVYLADETFIIVTTINKLTLLENHLSGVFNQRIISVFPPSDIADGMVYPSPDHPLPIPLPMLSFTNFTAQHGHFPTADQLFETIINQKENSEALDITQLAADNNYSIEKHLSQNIDWQLFRDLLDSSFNESQLKELCNELEISYEKLPGHMKRDKSLEIISFCQRHDRTKLLLEIVQARAPRAEWNKSILQTEHGKAAENVTNNYFGQTLLINHPASDIRFQDFQNTHVNKGNPDADKISQELIKLLELILSSKDIHKHEKEESVQALHDIAEQVKEQKGSKLTVKSTLKAVQEIVSKTADIAIPAISVINTVIKMLGLN